MGAVSLQRSLFVDGGEFVGRLHKRSKRDRVWLANLGPATTGRVWQQRGLPLPDAVALAQAWADAWEPDCYAAANGCSWDRGAGRTVSAVRRLNGFFLDFDRYKVPQYADLTPEAFLDVLLADNPWLPVPSVFVDSGNGAWAFWLFKRPLPVPSKHDFLPQWQTLQDFLVRRLAAYGADPACSDASRVVRIAGTLNTKTERVAQAWATADAYEFASLKAAINGEYRRLRVEQAQQAPQKPLRAATRPKRVQGAAELPHNLYWVAHARMGDLKRLADLRGGRLPDRRKMAAWVYAVSAAHFCRAEDSLRAEVSEFIASCLAEPDRYGKRIHYGAVVDRYRAEQGLLLAGWTRQQARAELGYSKAQYTLTNRYIIDVLNITPAEQRKLVTLIGPDEKRRRHAISERKRRRAAGAGPRADYLTSCREATQQRREAAYRMRQQGLSVREIAQALAVTERAVKLYLSAIRRANKS